MSYTFSGPSFGGLFPAVTGAFCIGTVYKTIAEVPSPAYILMTREVADYLLYQFATLLVESSRGRAAIYAFTNLTVNIAALVAMRRRQMIGLIGTAIFISLMAVESFCKVSDFSKYRF